MPYTPILYARYLFMFTCMRMVQGQPDAWQIVADALEVYDHDICEPEYILQQLANYLRDR